MKRIIHLDFKGAPLKLPYLEKVLLLAKSWGATGVLLEWEDTFPYSGQLSEIGSLNNAGGDNLYSNTEVQHILKFLKGIDLEAIQLVQTVGHLQFVLKHPAYRNLREQSTLPSTLCPSNPDSRSLVKAILEQVLDIQPDATYFHIGGDGAEFIGSCGVCKQRSMCSESLYLEYLRDLVLLIKQKRPELTILMWDSMLRPMNPNIMKAFGLGDLVQPVLQNYSPAETFSIAPDLWQNYKEQFPCVWVASAFKGADGSCKILSPARRYVSNHEAWIEEIKKYKDNIEIPGIILTGSSRYNHYATLCELMPVSMPSLYSCLKTLTNPESASKDVEMDIPLESWPGERLYLNMQKFMIIKEGCEGFLHGDLLLTWMNPWQLENDYTEPIGVYKTVTEAEKLCLRLAISEHDILEDIVNITGNRSVREWRDSYILPLYSQVRKVFFDGSPRLDFDASVRPTLDDN